MVTLTPEDRKYLSQFHQELTAAKDATLRYVGRAASQKFKELYLKYTGNAWRESDNCGRCSLHLQQIIAQWYFDTIASNLAPVEKLAAQPAPKRKPSTRKK